MFLMWTSKFESSTKILQFKGKGGDKLIQIISLSFDFSVNLLLLHQ